MARVGVLDHGMGNLRSVAKALEASGADVVVSSDQDVLRRSAALCVPGQGIFGRCMRNLRRSGMDAFIRDWIDGSGPYLGICLGLQVLFETSEEPGDTSDGLRVLSGHVKRLPDEVRVPHIGWNEVATEDSNGEHFYFDHSYAPHPDDPAIVKGWCEHGDRFAAWIEAGSVTAVQFHPEKSSRAGIELLERWVASL